MRALILSAALAAAPLSTAAQTPLPPVVSEAPAAVRSMAAGYKALMVCGALKNAEAAGGERTLDSVEANELVGIYPELDPLVRVMPVEIDGASFSIAWDDAMPPRMAVYRPGRGCSVLPVGWSQHAVDAAVPGPAPAAPFLASPVRGDAAALAEAVERAFEGGYGEGANSTAVIVLQDGRSVAERYAAGFGPDTPQRTWSVAKSLAGTIIGAAVRRGEVDVNAPAPIREWSREGDPRGGITLDNLLRMASGLTSDTAGNRTDALYFGGVGVDEQAPTWPLIAPPGTRYRYANNDTLLAVLGVSESFDEHPPAELFARLGMHDTWAETDWRGAYVLSSQVWSTARDLARFGQLYVDDGMVDGEHILPEDWLEYVSRPSGPQPRGEQGYGATFWLFDKSEGIPADAISANGNRGQYVIIVPSRKIVIVRRGEDPAGARFDHIAFTRDVLAALD
ncbi:MAG: serine hydrolase [Brevundimonas sp.]|nr:serine hydrolase [Brevundimonas sp.]